MALKHTTPSAPAPSASDTTPYQHIVRDVLAQARPLMERVAEATRMSLLTRQDQARTPGEHNAMHEARQQLSRLASGMGERYPDALRKALDQEAAQNQEKPTRSLFTVHFDDLELMDEAQINDSVERARARQVLISAVEGPLADLDALVCAAPGLARVQPEHNPLRPEVFLQALQTVVSQMQVTPQVRHDWMGPMAQALGTELRGLYLAQIDRLKLSGVQPVGYAMRQADGQVVYVAPTEGGASPGFAADNDLSTAEGHADSLLTLDRLRRLLLGEFSENPAPTSAPAAGRQQHRGQPCSPASQTFRRTGRGLEHGGGGADGGQHCARWSAAVASATVHPRAGAGLDTAGRSRPPFLQPQGAPRAPTAARHHRPQPGLQQPRSSRLPELHALAHEHRGSAGHRHHRRARRFRARAPALARQMGRKGPAAQTGTPARHRGLAAR